jgi:hypothetical protein
MVTPSFLPSPGHVWFPLKAVEALLQPVLKLALLPVTELEDLADSLNVATTKLLIELQLDSGERRQRPALLGLAKFAHALMARLDTGASAARQIAAFRWAM